MKCSQGPCLAFATHEAAQELGGEKIVSLHLVSRAVPQRVCALGLLCPNEGEPAGIKVCRGRLFLCGAESG